MRLRTLIFFLLALLGFSCRLSAPQPASYPTPAETRDAKWQQDLDYLATELPRLHGNLFFKMSEADFTRQIGELREKIPQLSDNQIKVEMAQIIAQADNAHTSLNFKSSQYPFQFWWFADGIFVTATTPDYQKFLRAKLLQVGEMPIEETLSKIAMVIASEGSESWLKVNSTGLLPYEETIQGLGLANAEGKAEFLLQTEQGETARVIVTPLKKGAKVSWMSGCRSWPRYRGRFDKKYWFEIWDDSKTLYLQYNSCAEDAAKPFAEFAREVMETWDKNSLTRMIVDMRDNGGGNSAVIGPLLDEIRKRPSLNRRGSLFVLSGRFTFSSAAMNLADFKEGTQALIVGSVPGGNPYTPFREVMSFQLPNSQLSVSCNWRYLPFIVQLIEGSGEVPKPDLPTDATAAEFFDGRDVDVEAALASQ